MGDVPSPTVASALVVRFAVLQTTRSGPVTVLAIARPEAANALDATTRVELRAALDAAEADDAIRAVVLTGAGDRVFSAGLDLADLPDDFDLDRDSIVMRVRRAALPVVAAVNGAAVGGGFELVLACDMVVAADHARFWLPEVHRAIVPTEGGTRLSQRLPLAVANELVLTGHRLDAGRAQQLGLVNRVVPGPAVVDEAVALATAAAEGAPLAVEWARHLLRQSLTEDEERLQRAEAETTRRVLSSADIHEGSRAFLEKRAPRWHGR